MEASNKTRLKQNKYLILATIGLLLILLGIIVGNIVARTTANDSQAVIESHTIDVEELDAIAMATQETPHVLLGDSSLISKFIGDEGTTTALNILSESILDYIGPDAAGEYNASVAGNSIRESVLFPYSTLSFTVSVDDDAIYNVSIALAKDRYYAMLVAPYQLAGDYASPLTIVYLQNANVGNYNRDETISELVEWAKSITDRPITVTTEDLFE